MYCPFHWMNKRSRLSFDECCYRWTLQSPHPYHLHTIVPKITAQEIHSFNLAVSGFWVAWANECTNLKNYLVKCKQSIVFSNEMRACTNVELYFGWNARANVEKWQKRIWDSTLVICELWLCLMSQGNVTWADNSHAWNPFFNLSFSLSIILSIVCTMYIHLSCLRFKVLCKLFSFQQWAAPLLLCYFNLLRLSSVCIHNTRI